MARLKNERGRQLTLKPVRPNVGIRAAYRRKLARLIDDMIDDYDRAIRRAYKRDEPAVAKLAADALASNALKRAIKKLAKTWNDRFDDAADKLAAYFSRSVSQRSDRSLQKILRDGGFSVKFKMTHAMQDVLNATVAENVALIRSIPEEFHTALEGIVMRSVTVGRDLSALTQTLEKRYGLTRNRAAFIARDQNNKATANFTRVRQLEMGITEAIWLHSAGGRKPRPTHVKNSGQKYDVAKGWYDPAVKAFIYPGFLPNCRCVSKPLIRGFS